MPVRKPPRRAGGQRLGKAGEDHAVEYLRGKHCVILHRNWRCPRGELDIVATDGIRLIVAEVKTRSGTGFGAPAEAVPPAKAERIRELTRAWLAEYPLPLREIRFDVLAVLWPPGRPPEVEHIEGAF
nr:YraN family protein [Sciscionella sp. SE31]